MRLITQLHSLRLVLQQQTLAYHMTVVIGGTLAQFFF